MALMSYSSLKLIQNCQQKYVHHKILETPSDSDYTPSDALDVGTIFHRIMEISHHGTKGTLEAAFNKAVEETPCPEGWWQKLHAMIRAYALTHKFSGLMVTALELEIQDGEYIGYVDAIMSEPSGNWWIVDLKTTSRFEDHLLTSLPYDLQMAAYSSRYLKIAQMLTLDPNKFKGCRYRTVTKPGPYKMGKNEDEQSFIDRMMNNITCTDIEIPKATLALMWDEYVQMENEAISKALAFAKGSKENPQSVPLKNRNACIEWGKPCQFWSKCHHGVEFSNSKKLTYRDGFSYRSEGEIL